MKFSCSSTLALSLALAAVASTSAFVTPVRQATAASVAGALQMVATNEVVDGDNVMMKPRKTREVCTA